MKNKKTHISVNDYIEQGAIKLRNLEPTTFEIEKSKTERNMMILDLACYLAFGAMLIALIIITRR